MSAARSSDIDLDVRKIPPNYTLDGYEVRVRFLASVKGYPDEYNGCQMTVNGDDGNNYIGAYNYKDYRWESKMYILLEDHTPEYLIIRKTRNGLPVRIENWDGL